MALGDLPTIPGESIPRFQALMRKLAGDEITPKEVGDRALAETGRVRIDAAGVSVTGGFGCFKLEKEEFRAGVETVLNALKCLPLLKGKEILVKRGEEMFKLRFGLLMKKIPSGEWEASDPKLPMIEFDETASPSGVKAILRRFGADGADNPDERGGPGPIVKIHRLEEIAGWTRDWEEFSRMIDILVAAIGLTTRRTITRVDEAAPAFIDHVLTRCGV